MYIVRYMPISVFSSSPCRSLERGFAVPFTIAFAVSCTFSSGTKPSASVVLANSATTVFASLLFNFFADVDIYIVLADRLLLDGFAHLKDNKTRKGGQFLRIV